MSDTFYVDDVEPLADGRLRVIGRAVGSDLITLPRVYTVESLADLIVQARHALVRRQAVTNIRVGDVIDLVDPPAPPPPDPPDPPPPPSDIELALRAYQEARTALIAAREDLDLGIIDEPAYADQLAATVALKP